MPKLVLAAVAALLGTAPVCAVCHTPGSGEPALAASVAVVAADTAVAKLAIEGMTCGSCATTARIALQRVPGVYKADVSYDSASAVVRYDPARTEPGAFIAKLKEMTGYEARITERTPAKPAS